VTDNDDLGQHPSKRRCPLPDCGLWSHCDHTVADVFDRIAELEERNTELEGSATILVDDINHAVFKHERRIVTDD